jgi:hypothetical protein
MTNFFQNSADYLCKKRMRHVFIRHHLYRQKNFDFLTAFLKNSKSAHSYPVAVCANFLADICFLRNGSATMRQNGGCRSGL